MLFICNQHQHRSVTAEQLFKKNHNTQSAGIYNDPVTEKQLAWADLIIVMEETQREELGKRFPKYYLTKNIINLNIPDLYNRNNPQLKLLLQERMQPLL